MTPVLWKQVTREAKSNNQYLLKPLAIECSKHLLGMSYVQDIVGSPDIEAI